MRIINFPVEKMKNGVSHESLLDVFDKAVENKKWKEYASEQTDKLNVEKENVIQLERCWKETKRAMRLLRAECARRKWCELYYEMKRDISNFKSENPYLIKAMEKYEVYLPKPSDYMLVRFFVYNQLILLND